MSPLAGLLAAIGAAAASPDDGAIGLPGRAYTDVSLFDMETNGLLSEGWICLGREDEVPNPGDFYVLTVLGEPLLIVRGEDGEVRVMSNLCRHRSMPLAEGRGNAARFVCSYHAWAYGRDGALLRAARMKNTGFDAASCRLPQFRSLIWRGFIYASLADDPAPFTAPEAGLDALVAPYRPQDYRLVHVAEEDWRCNWKLLVENFMEGYHLSVVHPQTLHGYTPTGLSRKGPDGAGFTSYFANYPDSADSRGMGAPDLSHEQRRRSTLFAVFPGQVVSLSATLLVSLTILPLAPDLIRVKWTMSTYGDELDAETLQQRIALWDEVNREDREKLEWMQKGLSARQALAGPLAGADYEGTTRDFHRWLADSLLRTDHTT